MKSLPIRQISGLKLLAARKILLAAGLGVFLGLTGCQGGIDGIFPKEDKPLPHKLVRKIKEKGMTKTSPIMLRIFKTENVMEVWKQTRSGRYGLLETYEICKWSGRLGPKFKEGDKQAPEGFYSVGRPQMNPNSKYHLSFNIGFPNTYDRAHSRTGRHLMVHGACSSAGCYSMTDELVEEIYALAREAFNGGQKKFQVQAYPFRMTPKNMAKNASHKHFEFWKMLKEGYDHFELTKRPPKVDVCEKRYLFNRVAEKDQRFSSRAECPSVTMPERLLLAYSDRREKEQDAFSKILKRQISKSKLSGEQLSLPASSMTLVAKGSEVLPPPTPKPAPVVPKVIPIPETAPVLVSNNQQTKPVAPTVAAPTTVPSTTAPTTAPVAVPVTARPAQLPELQRPAPVVKEIGGGTLTTVPGGRIITLDQSTPSAPNAPTGVRVAQVPAVIPIAPPQATKPVALPAEAPTLDPENLPLPRGPRVPVPLPRPLN